MDIIVTTPKSEIETSKKEGEAAERDPTMYWFRTFRFKPRVKPGDKIYFVESGQIKGYGIIFEVSKVADPKLDSACEVTDRVWGNPGDWMVKYRNWHWLEQPIPFKGFQGIRYAYKYLSNCVWCKENTNERLLKTADGHYIHKSCQDEFKNYFKGG
jgi:hypothetical protein